MIRLEGVALVAGTFRISGLSFTVPTGGYAALMGRTGTGKTTILEGLCGLRKVQAGSIHLAGRDVTGLPPAQRNLGYVPQDRALFRSMNVWENLAFALNVRNRPAREVSDRVAELASLLKVEHLLQRRPHNLSGGESQRVALGRALAFRPPVLVLDEPLAGLDEDMREELYDLLHSIRRYQPLTTLHVTHDRTEAARLADRILFLDQGRIEERAVPDRPGG